MAADLFNSEEKKRIKAAVQEAELDPLNLFKL